MDRHEVEQMWRSIPMATPESLVLGREDALKLLARLHAQGFGLDQREILGEL